MYGDGLDVADHDRQQVVRSRRAVRGPEGQDLLEDGARICKASASTVIPIRVAHQFKQTQQFDRCLYQAQQSMGTATKVLGSTAVCISRSVCQTCSRGKHELCEGTLAFLQRPCIRSQMDEGNTPTPTPTPTSNVQLGRLGFPTEPQQDCFKVQEPCLVELAVTNSHGPPLGVKPFNDRVQHGANMLREFFHKVCRA